jgi:phytoene synthase
VSRHDAVDASYRHCRRLSRRAGSSFYRCFGLLPSAKRRAMDALYAFMRHTDDLADNRQPTPRRAAALVGWRAALQRALLGQEPLDEDATHLDAAGRALLPALADAVAAFNIPAEHLHAVIDGVEMDLRQDRYETFEVLEHYCQRVASAVGLACIHVWGFRGPEALEPARKCGVAMQLTNILRDVKEDAEEGRVYLPLADLRRHGYSVDDLLDGVADDRFRGLMETEIRRARRYYDEGGELSRWLEPDGRRILGMMTATYRALLEEIARRPEEVLRRRVRLSRWRKLGIAVRWMLMPPGGAAPP